MTNPVSNKVQVTGYAGVQAGIIKSLSDNAYLNSGATLGGQVSYKGTFLRGQVEAGTALGGKVELGHTFDIGRNMGLELSAKAQMNKSLIGNNSYNVKFENNFNINNQNASVEIPSHSDFSTNWKGGETRLGASAKLTFGSEKARFGVGIEAGSRKGNQPNMAFSTESNTSVDVTTNQKTETINQNYSSVVVNSNKSSFYATPTISADVKLNKHLSLNANADLQQGQIGVRWNF